MSTGDAILCEKRIQSQACMEGDWVRQIRDRCVSRGIPFFFKQWGGVNKKRTGRTLDGRTWNDMPNPSIALNEGQAVG